MTSPQAVEGLRIAGRKPWRRESVIAAVDHNVPTTPAERVDIDAISDPLSFPLFCHVPGAVRPVPARPLSTGPEGFGHGSRQLAINE